MKNHKIFDNHPVNCGRQPEVDLSKAVRIFLLAFVHCTIECTSDEGLETGIPYLFDTVIGGPLGAPLFIFAMGIGVAYTKKNSAADFLKRGAMIGIAGFVLNIFRYTIPYLLGYAITSDREKYITPLIYRTFCDDILQCAAVALILIGLFKLFKIPDAVMGILSVLMAAAGSFLVGTDVKNVCGNILLSYIVGVEDKAEMVFSDFPLLDWFVVLAAGYLFGKCLRRVRDKKMFYLTISPAALIVAAVYFAVGISNGTGMFGEGQNAYYHMLINDTFMCIIVACGLLGIDFLIVSFLPERIMYWVKDISRNITNVYCVHWVMVVLIIDVFIYAARGTQKLPILPVMIIALFISVTSITISHLWSCRKSNP